MSEPGGKPRSMIDLDEFERRLRRPLPKLREDSDPLTELARLVAGERDPYRDVFAEAPEPPPHAEEPAWEPVAEPSWEPVEGPEPVAPPRRGPAMDFAAIEAGLLRGSVQPEFHQAAEPSFEPQPASFHAARYQDPEVEWQAADPEAAPRSRKPLYMMAAVILLGIAGIGASFAYKGRIAGAQQIATIMAAPGPTKVQPPQQDDAAAAQSASVLDKSAAPTTVSLADHREEPVDVTQIKGPLSPDVPVAPSQPAPVAVAPSRPQPVAALPVPPPAAPTPAQFQQPVGIAALIEPKKVRTVSVRPDGTLLPNDTPPRADAVPVPPAPATVAAVAKPSTPRTATHVVTPPTKPASSDHVAADAPLSLTPPVKTRPAVPKPVRVAEATPAATERPARAAEGSGDFAVQLAAPGTEKEARETSSRLEHQFASELDGHQPSIRKAKVGDKDVYRIRVSGLSREDAAGICQKIQAGGGKCFIARN